MLTAKDFFLYQDYPAFKVNGSTVVFDYDKFITLTDDITLSEPFISKKVFDTNNPIITFITTHDCNLNCRYCSVSAGDTKLVMDFNIAKTVIDKTLQQNLKIETLHIIFFGGEPSMSYNLIQQIIVYIKQLGVNVNYYISTNGVLSKSFIELLSINKFIVNLSFDGIPDIQDIQRPLTNGKPSHSFVEKTIKSFLSKDIIFKVRATVTDKSVDSMLDFMQYLQKLGVKTVHFEPLNICGRAENLEFKSPELTQFISNYKKCVDFASDNDMELVNGVYDNLFNPSFDYCSAITGKKLVITPNGYITRCYEIQSEKDLYFSKFVVGKVTDNDIILFPNQEENINNILGDIKNHCKDCFAKYICSTGCTIRTYRHLTDDRFDIDYRCNFAKELISDFISRFWQESLNT